MAVCMQTTLCGTAARARRAHPPAQESRLLPACAGAILGRAVCGHIFIQGAGLHEACAQLALRAVSQFNKLA